MADHLRGHPGHGARKAHNGADVVPLAGRAEVAHLHHQIIGDEDTENLQNTIMRNLKNVNKNLFLQKIKV